MSKFDPTKTKKVTKKKTPRKGKPKITLADKVLLDGYKHLPKKDWDKIQKGTHIRFINTTDNGIKLGGYVDRQFTAKNGKKYFVIKPAPDKPEFLLAEANISHLFVKVTAFTPTPLKDQKILLIDKFLFNKFGREWLDFKRKNHF